MIEINAIGLVTGKTYQEKPLPDDIANRLIEKLNKRYPHTYYWGVRIMDFSGEG